MSAPPWGHKPPAVENVEDHWTAASAPPEPSERCRYWLRRLDEGSWKPNRRFHMECASCNAQWLGVWIYEYLYVIAPRIDELEKEAKDEQQR